MPQMSQILRERAIGMLTARMSTRDARECNVNFSTISLTTADHVLWRCVGMRFAYVNIVNKLPRGGEVMVWAGISYRQQTQLHLIPGRDPKAHGEAHFILRYL